jgi:putative FmdB family regulatory protein
MTEVIMPIYEYVCLDCGKDFELIRSMSQKDAPMACSVCGGENIKRKLALAVAMSGGHAVSGAGGGCNCGSCSGDCGSCGH